MSHSFMKTCRETRNKYRISRTTWTSRVFKMNIKASELK